MVDSLSKRVVLEPFGKFCCKEIRDGEVVHHGSIILD